MKKQQELRVRKGVPLNLKKRNAWFNALSAKNKRIEIMKEIIWAMSFDLFRASMGYFDMHTNNRLGKDIDIQTELEVNKDGAMSCSCSGCEIAALLYARIRLGNEAKGYKTDGDYHIARGQSKIYQLLEGIFSDKQLRLMECAYERNKGYLKVNDDQLIILSWNDRDRVESFNHHVWIVARGGDSNRRSAGFHSNQSIAEIAENVIANNGEFDPFDLEYLKVK